MWLVRDNGDEPYRLEADEPNVCWQKIPVAGDIVKAAEACYLESEYLDSGAIVATISRFLAEERDRQIEAAPELLEVAKRILDRGYVSASIEEERGDHLALVAAISKAEGRA